MEQNYFGIDSIARDNKSTAKNIIAFCKEQGIESIVGSYQSIEGKERAVIEVPKDGKKFHASSFGAEHVITEAYKALVSEYDASSVTIVFPEQQNDKAVYNCLDL